jgi:hypothetical protein
MVVKSRIVMVTVTSRMDRGRLMAVMQLIPIIACPLAHILMFTASLYIEWVKN